MSLRKSALTGVSAIALSVGLACGAQADVLPVTNLTFNMLDYPVNAALRTFSTTVMPTNWSIGAAAQISNLIYVGAARLRGFSSQGHGNIYKVYANPPGFSVTVPAGTNFYQADGNPAVREHDLSDHSRADSGHDIHPSVPAGGRSASGI